MSGHWEHFSHGADIGVRGYGDTLSEAFEQAALAMTAAITNPDQLASVEAVGITLEAFDNELLLADWLNSLVYEMATRKLLFNRFTVHITNHRLQATAWGEKVDVTKHQPAVEIKGATYTELKVSQDIDRVWCAQCVVDV